MKSWRLLNSFTRGSKKAIPSQPAQLQTVYLCVKRVCLEATVVLEPLVSWQGGEKTLSLVSHVFIALREFFSSLEWGVGKLRERNYQPFNTSRLLSIESFSSKESCSEFLYLSLLLCELCSAGPGTAQMPATPARLEEEEGCVFTCASEQASIRSPREFLPYWQLIPIGSLSRIYTASFIILLTSGIIKSQYLSLRALGSGPQDCLFQPRGNSPS